jgi:acetylornithine/succinyldiaminopimelate/putrescine aminotransferase
VPGTHASTFGGNPLAMAACIAVLETILEQKVLENCRKQGLYLLEKLAGLKSKYKSIKEIRGKGLIVGMELTIDGSKIVERCLRRGLLINCTAENVIRFVPPLIVSKSEIDQCVGILDEAMQLS